MIKSAHLKIRISATSTMMNAFLPEIRRGKGEIGPRRKAVQLIDILPVVLNRAVLDDNNTIFMDCFYPTF